MVEKDMDSEESAIFVEASAAASDADHRGDDSPRTIGSAIQLLEAKLAETGLILQVPSPKKQENETESKKEPKEVVVPMSGKLVGLPAIVAIGIASAINNGFGTRASVGKTSSEKALVPGNVVALHSRDYGAFLRVSNGKVDCGGGSRSRDQLPFDWDSERFLVVDAGHGQVAFYNIFHGIFLGIDHQDSLATVSNGNCSVTSLDDRPRGNESFLPVKQASQSDIRLHCGTLNKTLSIVSSTYNNFKVVQIHGFT
jgi:hypothetical protein